MVGDVANYIKISRQPTALEAIGDPRRRCRSTA
jgi:hypothetical protein